MEWALTYIDVCVFPLQTRVQKMPIQTKEEIYFRQVGINMLSNRSIIIYYNTIVEMVSAFLLQLNLASNIYEQNVTSIWVKSQEHFTQHFCFVDFGVILC